MTPARAGTTICHVTVSRPGSDDPRSRGDDTVLRLTERYADG